MRRAWALLIGVVAAMAILAASPADAKTPAFTLEVLPAAAGQHAGEVSLRVVMDSRFGDFDPPDLEGLVAAFPESSLTDDLRPRPDARAHGVAIGLRLIAPLTYEGTVELPEPEKTWVIVPFPSSAVDAQDLVDGGYPPSIRVNPDVATQAPTRNGIGVTAGLIILGAALVWLRRRQPQNEAPA